MPPGHHATACCGTRCFRSEKRSETFCLPWVVSLNFGPTFKKSIFVRGRYAKGVGGGLEITSI